MRNCYKYVGFLNPENPLRSKFNKAFDCFKVLWQLESMSKIPVQYIQAQLCIRNSPWQNTKEAMNYVWIYLVRFNGWLNEESNIQNWYKKYLYWTTYKKEKAHNLSPLNKLHYQQWQELSWMFAKHLACPQSIQWKIYQRGITQAAI